MFYAYAYPAADQFKHRAVEPGEAWFDTALGEFLLPYEAVRTSDDPTGTLMRLPAIDLRRRRRGRADGTARRSKAHLGGPASHAWCQRGHDHASKSCNGGHRPCGWLADPSVSHCRAEASKVLSGAWTSWPILVRPYVTRGGTAVSCWRQGWVDRQWGRTLQTAAGRLRPISISILDACDLGHCEAENAC